MAKINGLLPTPNFEKLRVANLRALSLINCEAKDALKDLVLLASRIMDAPVAGISFIDSDKQYFKATVGWNVSESPRLISFCSHTLLDPFKPLVVPDMLESTAFRYHPLVVSYPHVRSYAGIAVLSPDHGCAIGSLCVIDYRPRHFTEMQLAALCELSKIIEQALK